MASLSGGCNVLALNDHQPLRINPLWLITLSAINRTLVLVEEITGKPF